MRSATVRYLLGVITYAVSLVAVAALAFLVVIVLAGPHSGLMPGWLEAVVLVLGWLTVLVAPVWITRTVWRRWLRTAA